MVRHTSCTRVPLGGRTLFFGLFVHWTSQRTRGRWSVPFSPCLGDTEFVPGRMGSLPKQVPSGPAQGSLCGTLTSRRTWRVHGTTQETKPAVGQNVCYFDSGSFLLHYS